MSVNKKKSQNKKFALISLLPVILVNVIFSDPIVYGYQELVRYFQNGYQSTVLGFFFENVLYFVVISLFVFIASFGLLKAFAMQNEINDAKLKDDHKKSNIISTDFKATQKIDNYLAFDEDRKKWATYNEHGLFKEVYNYEEIVDFELLEDGSSVASGGLGRALVGGILFGGTGAIVGGVTGKKKSKNICETLKLKVTINNIKNPVVYVNFIESTTKKDGNLYKNKLDIAQQCLSTLQLICDRQDGKNNDSDSSVSDEIMKYKELLDTGAITEDEYNHKKKQLLGI